MSFSVLAFALLAVALLLLSTQRREGFYNLDDVHQTQLSFSEKLAHVNNMVDKYLLMSSPFATTQLDSDIFVSSVERT